MNSLDSRQVDGPSEFRRRRENLTPGQISFRALGAVVCLAVLLTSFILDPRWAEQRGIVLCVSRALTGIPCPGCGLTRSFCVLAHGHVGAAFDYHLFGPFFFLLTLFLFLLWSLEVLLRRRLVALLSQSLTVRLAWIGGGALLAYQLTRLIMLQHSGLLLPSMKASLAGTLLTWLLRHLAG